MGSSAESISALIEAVARKRRGASRENVRLALKAEAHRRRVKYEPTDDVVHAIANGTWGRRR